MLAPAALIIIDMQHCMGLPEAGARNNPQAETNMLALLAAWRAAEAPVMHVRHMSSDPASLFWPGQPGAAFQAAFMPLPGEAVMEKNVPDAFARSGLERWLLVRNLQRLVIVGVSTSNSVEATARSAGCLGFAAHVVEDACFTFAKRDRNGTLRSAEEVHAMSLANLDGEYARLVRTADAMCLCVPDA